MTLRCLGRLPKLENSKTPLLRTVFEKASISVVPTVTSTNWRAKVSSWPMLGNDTVGDCVIAGALHFYQCVSANANTEIIPQEVDAIADYTAVGLATEGVGYDPVTHANDNGLVLDLAVNFWIKTGLAISPQGSFNQLAGQARIDESDTELLKVAIAEFCGALGGVNLPTTAQTEIESGKPWTDTSGEPGSWGGHCVYIVDFDADWVYLITWGQVQKASWAWLEKYSDEYVALLSTEWLNAKTKLSPSSLTLSSLDEQIEEMKGVLGVNSNVAG